MKERKQEEMTELEARVGTMWEVLIPNFISRFEKIEKELEGLKKNEGED